MSVAPNRSAQASFGAARSTAINRSAPATRALQRRRADPTESDHRHAGAGPYLRRLDRRTDPRGDAAAEEARAPQRGARAASGSPAPREPRCARRACRARGCLRAARRLAPGGHGEAAATRASSDEARRADTVRTYRTGPPMPARRGRHVRRVHAVAHLLDDAGSLVAEEHREGRPPVPVLDRPQVRVTHAARHEAHEDLAGFRRVDREIFDTDLAADRIHHRADRLSRHPLPLAASGSC